MEKEPQEIKVNFIEEEATEGQVERQLPIVYPLSPRDLSRLVSFDNILRRMHETRQANKADKRNNFGFVNEEGKVTDVFFRLDEKFSTIMSEMADQMYQSDFSRNERLASSARAIADNLNREYDPAGDVLPMEGEVFNRLWNADTNEDERTTE